MRFFLNFVKELIFFLVLALIMFLAWYFISNTFLNKNLHITKKENKEVIEKPVKKEEEVIEKPVKKEEEVIEKPVKKEEEVIEEPVKKEEEEVIINKPMKKVKRKIYRKVKKTRKTNWAKRQYNNYRIGNKSVFTPIN